MEAHRIPLFPLNVVLFPGMLLPLHIFEPRYQQMIRECLDGNRTFGVCLIREGEEVGGPADPCSVGTTCEILGATPLDEGRMNLVTVGRRRFRVLNLIHEQPYLEAQVEFFPDHSAGQLEALPERVGEAARAYIGLLLDLQGEQQKDLNLPGEAEALSYFVGGVLQVPLEIRQELLECAVTADRLRRQLKLLEEGFGELDRIRGLRGKAARPFRGTPSDLSLN